MVPKVNTHEDRCNHYTVTIEHTMPWQFEVSSESARICIYLQVLGCTCTVIVRLLVQYGSVLNLGD